MAVDKSLISGSTTMLILRLLEEKDMYGYEMIETLQEKSQNVFQLKAGTLYPLLHSLEEKGYVSRKRNPANNREVFVLLTDTAKRELAKCENNHQQSADSLCISLTDEEITELTKLLNKLY